MSGETPKAKGVRGVEIERAQLLENTPVNSGWWQRESTWTGLVGLLMEGAALATAVSLIPAATPGREMAVAAAILKFGASAVKQVSTWFVRVGVTNNAQKMETLAARTEEKLKNVTPGAGDGTG